MKKLILVFTLSLFAYLSFSQDWHPVTPNGVYHYTNINSSYATTTIFADSFKKDSNKTTYYLNRVPIKCDTCEWLEEYIKKQQGIADWLGIFSMRGSQFLQKKIKVSKNGIIDFGEPNHYTLKTNAKKEDIWVFDSTNLRLAKIINRSKGIILGEEDSFITYLISGDLNLILSKNHGIISFPDFENSGTFELIGKEGNKNGYNMPTVNEIMGFEVGDIFRYRDIFHNEDPTDRNLRYLQYEVLDKYYSGDSLILEREQFETWGYFCSGPTTYKVTVGYPKNSLPYYEDFEFDKIYNYQIVEGKRGGEVVYVRLGENNEGELTITLSGIYEGKQYYENPQTFPFYYLGEFPNVYKDFIVGVDRYITYTSYQVNKGHVSYEIGYAGSGNSSNLIGCRINNIVYGEIN